MTAEDLRAEAVKALAAVDPQVVSVKVGAMKILRDATGLSLRECAEFIGWAIERAEAPDRLALALRQAFTAEELRRMLADIGNAHGWTNEDGDPWDRFETALNQATKESRHVAMEIGERETVAPADVEVRQTGAVDLMAALRASLDRAKAARSGGCLICNTGHRTIAEAQRCGRTSGSVTA